MSGDRPRLPRALLFAELASILLASLLALPTPNAVPPLLVGLPVVIYGWLGARIAERAPRNPVGWLLSAAATAAALGFLAVSYATFGDRHGSAELPLADVVGSLAAIVAPPVVGVTLMLTFLLFPTGSPPSRRWLPVAWITVAAGVVAATAITLAELDVIDVSQGSPFDVAFIALTAVASGLTVASLWVRSRRGMLEERAPIRGLLGTLVAMAVSFAIFVWRAGDWDLSVVLAAIVLTGGTLILIPLGLTVSMLRYGLFDYEVGVRKRIAARVLAGLMILAVGIALFLVTTAIGGAVLADARSPNGEVPTMAALLVGVIAGSVLVLVARWAIRFAERVVFRDRASPYEVLSSFSERVGEGYSLDDVLPRMVALLSAGTGATGAHVWLAADGELRVIASAPDGTPPTRVWLVDDQPRTEDPATHAFAVRHQGRLLGALAVTMPTNDPMNPAKERLVWGLANQAGLVLRNVALLEDVRESRRRIVAAQDERARKLERDIHDGAQQQLVALAVRLRLAESLFERDPAQALGTLRELQSEATGALENLRDLARGIYPPLLAEEGLAAALEAQARKSPVPVEVDRDSVGRYPQEIESAVYFCALEALNNMAKYSKATRGLVRLEGADGELRFEVTDDGVGFDPARAGSGTGLQGMFDRIEALGGELIVSSEEGRGTTVTGRLPLEERR